MTTYEQLKQINGEIEKLNDEMTFGMMDILRYEEMKKKADIAKANYPILLQKRNELEVKREQLINRNRAAKVGEKIKWLATNMECEVLPNNDYYRTSEKGYIKIYNKNFTPIFLLPNEYEILGG